MKYKFLAQMDWSDIHLVPRFSVRLYQPELIDMDRFWTHTNFAISLLFLGFGIGLKIYVEQ